MGLTPFSIEVQLKFNDGTLSNFKASLGLPISMVPREIKSRSWHTRVSLRKACFH